MNSYWDEMKLCAPCSLMEVALQESEDQAAAALRRSLAVRKLIAGGMAAALQARALRPAGGLL